MSASAPWPAGRAVNDFAALEPNLAELWRLAATGKPGALDTLLSTCAAHEWWHRVLALAEVAHSAGLEDPISKAWEGLARLWLGDLERGEAALIAWAHRAEPEAVTAHARRLRAAFVDVYAAMLVAAHRTRPNHPELALAAAWRVGEHDATGACALIAPHAHALGVRGAALLHATGVAMAEEDLQAAWEADPDELAAALAWERAARDPAAVRARVGLHLSERCGGEPELGWALTVEWLLHHGATDDLWRTVSSTTVTQRPPPLWWRHVVVRAALLSGQSYEVTAEAALDAAWHPPVLRSTFELAVQVGGDRLAASLRRRGTLMSVHGLDDECLRYLELVDAVYEGLGEAAAAHRANVLEYRVRALIRAGRVREAFPDTERLLAWRHELASPPNMLAECHVHLATLHLAVGDLEHVDAALNAAAEAVAAAPEATRARIYLERARARHAAAAGDGPAAREALDRALAIDPNGPHHYPEHALAVAELAPTLGVDPVEAWHHALDACSRHLVPGDTDVQRARNHLAEAHLARGDVAAAAALVRVAASSWHRALLPPCADRVHTEVLIAVLDGRQADLVERFLGHIDPRWQQGDALRKLLLGPAA